MVIEKGDKGEPSLQLTAVVIVVMVLERMPAHQTGTTINTSAV